MRSEKAAAEATKLLVEFNITEAPVPVDQIAKRMGVDLRFSPLDDELSGMVFIKDGTPIIGINSLHHSNRQRFTIAHELGHFVLHRNEITNTVHVDKQFRVLLRDSVSAQGTDRLEIEANRFAAALLMPKHLVLKAIAESISDIDDDTPVAELAKKFKVSRQTMEYRVRNLA
ncbi:ImmA/IrrE family metallo-endopeptidase [Caballeronia zhejiangensis]|uniref:ImmA/IrrE family metallo-endopeptidase n=1 Tax=Caballeronia zhejiangensis TaxID=871203 RepID=UPI001EF4BD7F|nr:ImmA/IrrE family metallo-endopeptidase [Caballeronia zhejiangensis]MCG7400389.1 ImmA/IrrE family metallo-endopeptidase [Caballeronia zhejiangensis]